MHFHAVKTVDTPAVVWLPFQKGKVDVDLIASYTESLHRPEFDGRFKEVMRLFHVSAPTQVYLIGLGEEKDRPKAHEAFRWAAHERKKHWPSGMYVDGRHLDAAYIESAALGIALASYEIGAYKTQKEEAPAFLQPDFEVKFVAPEEVSHILKRASETAQSMKQIMALVDAPGNVKTPEFLADWATDSASTYGYTCEVLDANQLKEEGFDAVVAVGQGSQHPPVLLKVEHKPDDVPANSPKIGLVGKGITFDTGGLSIKPPANMHYMKSDMGGAAAVLGAVELAAKLNLPAHVVGVVAAAENAVDANSVKPGDVIGSYAGKTIEVIDTDAEGRLTLADALSYTIKQHQPDYLIDLATLTGSAVRALGYSAAAMFTHDDALADLVSEVGATLHERVWRLPLYDDFDADLHSDIADVRNLSGRPIAGAITAAKFLEFFVEKHPHWMHVDMAGVAFGDNPYAKMKSASGYGVRLLYAVMAKLTETGK